MKENNISENQIEDALVADLIFLATILKLPTDIKLIARQLRLKSGKQRADLILSSGKNLCLVELKAVNFSKKWLKQIISYRKELEKLQSDGKLFMGEILSFLLVTDAKKKDIKLSNDEGVFLIIYNPIDVLKNYYENLSLVAPFLKMKPNDYGVFNLGLINRVMIELGKNITNRDDIVRKTKLSKQSVHNHLKIGKEFGLVQERNKNYYLTDMGNKYTKYFIKEDITEILNEKQIELLKNFVAEDPFYSSTVFGIYSIVESAFLLSRNYYPINFSELRKMFQKISGKIKEWQAERSLTTATYAFLNFAIDLDLLGKIGKNIVITPAGFQFILMLQLHKSIEMIQSLSTQNREN